MKYNKAFTRYLNLRSSEIHLFYNLGDFYWHFLEILWLFIFLFLYSLFPSTIGVFYLAPGLHCPTLPSLLTLGEG
tara:strand:+ start:121 stop:345 length:225 start_codon:yes stop_codon:yes gene_type:complete